MTELPSVVQQLEQFIQDNPNWLGLSHSATGPLPRRWLRQPAIPEAGLLFERPDHPSPFEVYVRINIGFYMNLVFMALTIANDITADPTDEKSFKEFLAEAEEIVVRRHVAPLMIEVVRESDLKQYLMGRGYHMAVKSHDTPDTVAFHAIVGAPNFVLLPQAWHKLVRRVA